MSSTIRFIGNYDVNAEGKFIWEILCQLRNFGVGRIVTKNEWARKWPSQPSYIRVVRAEPAMDRWLFGGSVWGEWTYRGRTLGVYKFAHDLNRSDWRLIHKHEEEQFIKCSKPMSDITLPSSFPLPPLQNLFTKRLCSKTGAKYSHEMSRAPLIICIDPEFSMLNRFFKQAEPERKSTSIYDEVDSNALLDLYGNELPVKVEAWNVGPAVFKPRFSRRNVKMREQQSS